VHGLAEGRAASRCCLFGPPQPAVKVFLAKPERRSGSFRVETHARARYAKEVLLASGAYTTDATPSLRKKVIPSAPTFNRHGSSSESLRLRKSGPRNRMIYDSKHVPLLLIGLTPDKSRLLRRGPAPRSSRNQKARCAKSAELLRREMIEVYPQVARRKSRIRLGPGTLDFAMDVMPHSGRIDGMYFALGFRRPRRKPAATWMGAKTRGRSSAAIPTTSLPPHRCFPGAQPRPTSRQHLALPLSRPLLQSPRLVNLIHPVAQALLPVPRRAHHKNFNT